MREQRNKSPTYSEEWTKGKGVVGKSRKEAEGTTPKQTTPSQTSTDACIWCGKKHGS